MFLFLLRFLVVTFICILLLNPLFENVIQKLEKPVIIIAQDNSKSIKISHTKDFNNLQYESDLKQLRTSLKKDYEVKVYSFGDKIGNDLDFGYTAKQTDFSQLFEAIKTDFTDKNVGAIILASDGIVNKGTIPTDDNDIKASIYTIALGDTIPKKDLIVADTKYNTMVYLGNQHQLVVNISAKQAAGENSQLVIATNDGQRITAPVNINQSDFFKSYTFNIKTLKKGLQRIDVSLKNIRNEISLQNNRESVFVEVIDEKQNLLIYANAPHPDISALKQAIESKKSYSVTTKYAGDRVDDVGKYDLVILHQVPSNISNPAILKQISNKPQLFILGAASNIGTFNAGQNLVSASPAVVLKDVSPQVNSGFTGFSISDKLKKDVADWPILLSPCNNISVNGGSVLITNKANNQPLLAFSNNGQFKTAVLAGEGIWRWRLNDFKQHDSFLLFDELINKTIRYLTANQTRNKFWATPAHSKFAENERIMLEAGLYNDALEPINEPDVQLELKSNRNKKYSFLFTRSNKQYQLDAGFLPIGQYTFTASTKYGGKSYLANGEFVVEDNVAEYVQTTANHQLLFNLSSQTGGEMVTPKQINSLPALLKKSEFVKTIVHEDVVFEGLINLKYIFFTLLALIFAEWFLRKRNGLV